MEVERRGEDGEDRRETRGLMAARAAECQFLWDGAEDEDEDEDDEKKTEFGVGAEELVWIESDEATAFSIDSTVYPSLDNRHEREDTQDPRAASESSD